MQTIIIHHGPTRTNPDLFEDAIEMISNCLKKKCDFRAVLLVKWYL